MDKCVTCRYNTNSYVCHPHCSGCDGQSNYERGNFKMKGYNELATIIHENAVAHGWDVCLNCTKRVCRGSRECMKKRMEETA
jgi:hypothetical protein